MKKRKKVKKGIYGEEETDKRGDETRKGEKKKRNWSEEQKLGKNIGEEK